MLFSWRSTTPLVVVFAILFIATVAYKPTDAQYVPPPVVTPPSTVPGKASVAPPFKHEVWVLDQSDTGKSNPSNTSAPPDHGGRVYIYDGEALRSLGSSASAIDVVELAGATATLCFDRTGSRPVRPHMGAVTKSGSHVIISFVVSGHVVILDGASRTPLACFRTERGDQNRTQAHASVLTPDEKWILVANQNGKKIERISADFATNTFAQDPAATIDLANGVTPNGLPRQSPDARPDNAPICAFVPKSGFPLFVSLRGGGMLVLDPHATPLKIVAEYDNKTIAGDGCGFAEADGWVVGNGGSNANKPAGWFVYRLPIAGSDVYKQSNPPNTPSIQLLDQDFNGPRDAHGAAVTGNGRYVWLFDRVAHVAEVFETASGKKVTTLNLRSDYSDLPAVDIADVAPDGKFLYIATRGPRPLSGAHAAVGKTPGVMTIELLENGRAGAVRGISPISNLITNSSGITIERADPHGLVVRRTPQSCAAPKGGPDFGGSSFVCIKQGEGSEGYLAVKISAWNQAACLSKNSKDCHWTSLECCKGLVGSADGTTPYVE